MRKIEFKQLFLMIAMAMMAVTFTSCDKDDDKDDDTNVPSGIDTSVNLVGKWTLSSSNVSMKVGDKNFTDYMVEMLMAQMGLNKEAAEALVAEMMSGDGGMNEGIPTSGTMELKADGTYVALFNDDEADMGTWKVNDTKTKLTITSPNEDPEQDDDVMVFDIKTLTNSLMSIQMKEQQKEDMDEDGTDETTIDVEMNITFTR